MEVSPTDAPMKQHTTWVVQIAARKHCVVEGEYRAPGRCVQGSVRQTRPDKSIVRGSPTLEFGPNRNRVDWPDENKSWSDRVNFRFIDFSTPPGVRTFDTELCVDIWYEGKTKLPEVAGRSGSEYPGYVESRIAINCRGRPYESFDVDLELKAYVGDDMPAWLTRFGGSLASPSQFTEA
jgi:hypothetical protein